MIGIWDCVFGVAGLSVIAHLGSLAITAWREVRLAQNEVAVIAAIEDGADAAAEALPGDRRPLH